MQKSVKIFAMTAALTVVPALTASVFAGWYLPRFNPHRWHKDKVSSVQLGPRPFYLGDNMEKSSLKAADDVVSLVAARFTRRETGTGRRQC